MDAGSWAVLEQAGTVTAPVRGWQTARVIIWQVPDMAVQAVTDIPVRVATSMETSSNHSFPAAAELVAAEAGAVEVKAAIGPERDHRATVFV